MVKIGPSIVKLWSMLFVMKPLRCHSKPLITKMINKLYYVGKVMHSNVKLLDMKIVALVII
jgi:hypothetical protein